MLLLAVDQNKVPIWPTERERERERDVIIPFNRISSFPHDNLREREDDGQGKVGMGPRTAFSQVNKKSHIRSEGHLKKILFWESTEERKPSYISDVCDHAGPFLEKESGTALSFGQSFLSL